MKSPGSLQAIEDVDSNSAENIKDERPRKNQAEDVPSNTVSSIPKQQIICKLTPFNMCYRADEQGNLHPLIDRRPLRVIRLYK